MKDEQVLQGRASAVLSRSAPSRFLPRPITCILRTEPGLTPNSAWQGYFDYKNQRPPMTLQLEHGPRGEGCF